ncbi:MAG: (d)CMP kinase [Anaerolineales bacterium]
MSLDPEGVHIIAIDGPAASGKSTLAQGLSSRIGYLYFDTGVMYRAVTLAGLRAGIPASDENRITKLAFEISIDVRPPTQTDGRQYDVIVNGEDVTWEIRSEEVDANVSEVSAYSGVRQAMTERQREIGRRGDVIMVGRDIGTVVLPEADLKLYLDASVEARARRRYNERQARGEDVDYEEILESMRTRDRIDSSRDVAPLQPAEDAVIIDSTDLSLDETMERALMLIKG